MKKTEAKVHRVGIVADMRFAKDQEPPGFTAMVTALNEVLDEEVTQSTTMLRTTLDTKPDWSDRCHHHIEFDLDGNGGLQVRLDWQRVFSKAAGTNSINDARVSALAYFQRRAFPT